MFIQPITIAIILFLGLVSSDYDGFKVVEMNLRTNQEIDLVSKLVQQYQGDIWVGPSKVIATRIMINPQQLSSFLDSLKVNGIQYKIVIENVQKNIDEQANSNRTRRNMSKRQIQRTSYCKPVVNDHFATYDEIMKWTDYLEKQNYFVSTHMYGKSFEGRELRYVKISTGDNRRAIFIDAGIHAREWLSVSTINYILEKIIQNYNIRNSEIVEILSKYDLYFIPVFNPDGYAFSHTDGNRLWRKNRKPFNVNGAQCYGVDLNRNFDVDFGVVGTSSDPCSQIYGGPRAFSEPESNHFSKLVQTFGSNISLYFTLHAYSQLWIVPYGYTITPPSDDKELRRVANIGATALYNVNKEVYQVGSAGQWMYFSSGGSDDWMKLKIGVKYAYTIEVRPNENSSLQFSPPIEYIKLTGEEVYAGFIATIRAMQI